MSLLKEVREYIKSKFEDNPKMSKAELMELIEPHYIPDYQKLKEQDIGKIANYIASTVRDERGIRQVFSIDDNGKRCFIHVDKSKNLPDLRKVYKTLVKGRDSRDYSIEKVHKRGQEVAGQMSLVFDEVHP